METNDSAPEKRQEPITLKEAWGEIAFGVVFLAGGLGLAATTGVVVFLFGAALGVIGLLSGLSKLIRVSARRAAGNPPPTKTVTVPPVRTNSVRFEGRVGYEGFRGSGASVPVMNIDGVTVSDEAFSWELTTSGSGNANLGGSWKWPDIEVAGLVTTGSKPQVHVRSGTETVVFQGKAAAVDGLVDRLRTQLGPRFVA